MGKITGKETKEQLPEKVLLLYQAVRELIEEEADFTNLTVADITGKAGIGKGTAYDYFDSKEQIIVYAIFFNIEQTMAEFEMQLRKQENFWDAVSYALKKVRQKADHRNCIWKYMNLMFDSTQIGNLMRSKTEGASWIECPPWVLCSKMIRRGINEGALRDDLPIDYMTQMMLSKVLAYMAYLGKEEKNRIPDEQFEQLLLNGLMEEFGNKA